MREVEHHSKIIMNWAINNFYFIVLRSKCVNYFVDKLPVGASDDEVVYINGDGYLDGFDNTVVNASIRIVG